MSVLWLYTEDNIETAPWAFCLRLSSDFISFKVHLTKFAPVHVFGCFFLFPSSMFRTLLHSHIHDISVVMLSSYSITPLVYVYLLCVFSILFVPTLISCVLHSHVLHVLVVMIHWTDQIKELLNAQDIVNMRDSCGPLREISFWKTRSTQLLNISWQLQKPGVKHIQNILQVAKSLYVQRFCQLAHEIQVNLHKVSL